MTQDFMTHIRRGGQYMETGKYSSAHKEYRAAENIFKETASEVMRGLYEAEVMPSLELLREREILVIAKKGKEENLQDAERRLDGVCFPNGWHPERTAFECEVNEANFELESAVRKLQEYDSKLIGLWKEKTRQN